MSQQYPANGGYMAPQGQPPKEQKRVGVITMLAMAVLVFAILVILNETMLKIRNVAVIGNQKYSWNEVVKAAGLDRSASFFTIDEKTVANHISANNHFLILERMEKSFPNGLTLYVRERAPIARVQEMGVEYTLDEEGMVLDRIVPARDGNMYDSLMYITGLKPKDMRIGQIMQLTSSVQMEVYKALLREVILQGITGEISELNVADPENLYLITTDEFTAHLGGADSLRAKIGTVRAVVAYLRGEGSSGGMLEANIPGEVIFSPRTP